MTKRVARESQGNTEPSSEAATGSQAETPMFSAEAQAQLYAALDAKKAADHEAAKAAADAEPAATTEDLTAAAQAAAEASSTSTPEDPTKSLEFEDILGGDGPIDGDAIFRNLARLEVQRRAKEGDPAAVAAVEAHERGKLAAAEATSPAESAPTTNEPTVADPAQQMRSAYESARVDRGTARADTSDDNPPLVQTSEPTAAFDPLDYSGYHTDRNGPDDKARDQADRERVPIHQDDEPFVSQQGPDFSFEGGVIDAPKADGELSDADEPFDEQSIAPEDPDAHSDEYIPEYNFDDPEDARRASDHADYVFDQGVPFTEGANGEIIPDFPSLPLEDDRPTGETTRSDSTEAGEQGTLFGDDDVETGTDNGADHEQSTGDSGEDTGDSGESTEGSEEQSTENSQETATEETETERVASLRERVYRRVAAFFEEAANRQGARTDQRAAYDSYAENIQATADRERQERADQDAAYASYEDNINTTATREASEARAAAEHNGEQAAGDTETESTNERQGIRARLARMGRAVRNFLSRRGRGERSAPTGAGVGEQIPLFGEGAEQNADGSPREQSPSSTADRRAERQARRDAAKAARAERAKERAERRKAIKDKREADRYAKDAYILNARAAAREVQRRARAAKKERKDKRREENRELWRGRREAAGDRLTAGGERVADVALATGRAARRKARQVRAAAEGAVDGWKSVEK